MTASYYGTVSGHEVTETLEGCHPKHKTYPLLPGDILIKRGDGTWYKFGPGLGIGGFILTVSQQATLRPRVHQRFGIGGMDYFLGETP